jgi:hypothetical protein
LRIPVGASAEILSTGTVTGEGRLNGLGTIVNDGTISDVWVSDAADDPDGVDALTITGHNFLFTFDPTSSSCSCGQVRVYASTFAAGNRGLPALGWRGEQVLRGWNTSADGSAAYVTLDSALSSNATLYAQWTDPLLLTPGTDSVSAGSTIQFKVTQPIDAELSDITDIAIFESSDASDLVESSGRIKFTTAGTRTITVSTGSDPRMTDSATVTVEAGPPAMLHMARPNGIVTHGMTVIFTPEVTDGFSNVLANATSQIDMSSDATSDRVSGTSVTFSTAGVHHVSARYGTFSKVLAVNVLPASSRLAGGNRFSTSAAISAASFAPEVDVVYIANGLSFPDALSGAPVAGLTGGPILLVAPDSISSAVGAELDRLNPSRIVILGGTGVVSDALASKLARYLR